VILLAISIKQNRVPNKKSFEPQVELLIEEVIDNFLYKKEKITKVRLISLCEEAINTHNSVNQTNYPIPSKSTIYRRIKARECSEGPKDQQGDRYLIKNDRDVDQQENVTTPLQEVQIDHTLVDLFVVDEDKELPLGRPYITTCIDTATGCPLGFYIGFTPPSDTAIMNCLLHAIKPKTYVKELYPEIKRDWLAYGVPKLVVTDRGKEFSSRSLEDACSELGIELQQLPDYRPWMKGTIERFFRSLNTGLLHYMSGRALPKYLDKSDYDPEKNARISRKTFLKLIHIFLIEIYPMEVQSGPLPPFEMWKKHFEFTEPPLPTLTSDWEIELMQDVPGERILQRPLPFIQFNNLHYQNNALKELRERLVSKRKMFEMVKIKYDPNDLGSIYLYDPFNKRYIEVFCTDQEYSYGLSEYTHTLIKKMIWEKEKAYIDQQALNEANKLLMDWAEADSSSSKKIRRMKRERVKGSVVDDLKEVES
jgi:putative transposase